jgi:predicted ATPase
MTSSALDYITVKGFKSIASIEKLPLRPINILIGSNGSGKSNFIGVFAFLHAIREGRLRDYVAEAGGAERVLHFGSKTTKQIEVRLYFQGSDRLQYWVVLPTRDDNLYQSEESDTLQLSEHSASSWGERIPEISVGRAYHLDDTSNSSRMRKTAKVDDNRFLRPDGSNLAAFLYCLQEKYKISYSLIRRTIQQVAPFFDDFNLAPSRLRPDDIKLEWRHKKSDQYFDSGSFSDGTLRFIALATLFLQPKDYLPPVILVDEPELGLHPYAIEMLASLIRQASDATQVIVSTQSSLLLDYFNPEDVLVANRVNGGTKIERLEPERLGEWLKDYSLGQLWEKNEFAGRPVPE